MDKDFTKYLQYLKNTGESVTPEMFDEDWEPIGPMVRKDMEREGVMVVDSESGLMLVTEKGAKQLA